MTLDQIYMRLADKKNLRQRPEARRGAVDPRHMPLGPTKGRTADGKPLAGYIGPVSVAARLAAEAAAVNQSKRRRQARELRNKGK